MNGSSVWAAGYLTKYVERFYVDKELTTPITASNTPLYNGAGYHTFRYAGNSYIDGSVVAINDYSPNEYGSQWYNAVFDATGTKTSPATTVTMNGTV